MKDAEEALPAAVAEFLSTKESNLLDSVFDGLKDIDPYKNSLKEYFKEFVAQDIFIELRELILSEKITENLTDVILNWINVFNIY